jgi:TPR repeat protein
MLLLAGTSTPHDAVRAKQLFQRACSGGDEKACNNLKGL